MKVIAFGRLSIYEKTGNYQLYAEYLEPAGIGALQLAFNQLKEKLQAEGLFDQQRKRQIPRFAKSIAVITSPTGAAVQNIKKIIREKNPTTKILLRPATVQGENAATDLVAALREVNDNSTADVIILGRGGGSIEDLQAFNDETLAREIARSRIPVISAVGHETDFTISDFVADLRAPTPTAAAHLATFDHAQTSAYVAELTHALSQAIKKSITDRHTTIKEHISAATRAIQTRLANEQNRLTHQQELLEKVSPYAIFKRGFALVKNEENAILTTAKALQPGQNIHITWQDGKASAKIYASQENSDI
jgi:exodeoxyribonuclease VII large subunit